jgi:DNA-binding transcriptional ArsR family regulator
MPTSKEASGDIFDFITTTDSLGKRAELRRLIRSEEWKQQDSILTDQLRRLGEALSDETRIKTIIELLKSNYCSVASLSEKIPNIAQKTLYYHYNILKESRLINWSRKGRGKKLKRGDLIYLSDFAVSLIYDVLIPHPLYYIPKINELPQFELQDISQIPGLEEVIASDAPTSLVDEGKIKFDKEVAKNVPLIRTTMSQNLLPPDVLEKIKLIFLDEEVTEAFKNLDKRYESFSAVFPKNSKKGRIWKFIKRAYSGDSDEETIFKAFKKALSVDSQEMKNED